MTIIHMEPEQVRSVARQLEGAADQIHLEMEQVARRVRGIPWQSPGRESYVRAMEQLRIQSQAIAQQGLDLSRRVQQEVNEWEEAAASFGAGAASGVGAGVGIGAGITVPTDGHEKPENMKLLAKLVMEGNDPIRIYEIRPKEYLVVVQGTSHDPNTSRNWGSAVATGLGLSSDYQEQVRLALIGLPAGALVHMAGHSQGGIVAQNLAGNKSVQERVKVKTVTTFGSPYSAAEVNGVTYNRYAAEGDPVPYLEGRDATTLLLLSPFVSLVGLAGTAAGALSNRYPQTTIPTTQKDAHSEYDDSPVLEKTDAPFTITTWNGQPTVYDPGTAHSGAAVFYKNVVAPVATPVVQTAKSALDAAGNVAQSTANQVGNFFGNLF